MMPNLLCADNKRCLVGGPVSKWAKFNSAYVMSISQT